MSSRIIKAAPILQGRWRVFELLSDQGGCSEIYKAEDVTTKEHIAVKVEAWDLEPSLLQVEARALMSLGTGAHFLKFHGGGREMNEYKYVIMQLCGSNVRQLKKSMGDQLSASTSLRLIVQMVEAVRDVHKSGFLHLDVKPPNFCMGLEPHNKRTLYIIDFGFARGYRKPNGHLKEENKEHPPTCGGTMRYASPNTHRQKDMARVDDMWSLFYTAVEMLCSQLPWRTLNDSQQVLNSKETTDFGALLKDKAGCNAMIQMHEHLKSMSYYSSPNYELILDAFKKELQLIDANFSDPFDWEI